MSEWHEEVEELYVGCGRHLLHDVQIRVDQPLHPKSVSSRKHPGIYSGTMMVVYLSILAMFRLLS